MSKAEELIKEVLADLSVGDEVTLDHAAAVDDLVEWVRGEGARHAAVIAAMAEPTGEAECRERVLAAARDGVAEERARVVAWLRCESRAAPVKGREFNSMCRLADAIARGEHEEGT